MLFDYVAPASQPNRAGTVWSQFPLQPLAPGALTPFSYSVLAELASRAWYLYYDRLGFEPVPRSKVVRRYKGRVYFNLSICAQMEADHAALEPPSLQVNRQPQPLATWERPGLLAGFKTGRAQKKLDDTLADTARQMAEITEKAQAWYQKTQKIKRWGQAEVLQIMEEIERVGVEPMVAFLAARLNLGRHYARLVDNLASNATTNQALLLINHALCDLPGLTESLLESALGKTVSTLADSMAAPATLAWLKAGNFAQWRTELPGQEAIERIDAFMATYGHRTLHEGEIALPRWSEDASVLMRAILAYMDATHAAPVRPATTANLQTLLGTLPSAARKQGEQAIKKIGELHKLQSQALHALAYIWAGTRTWALAAAREAMVDKRLHSADEVFFFELEEIKQMMTGEWNISSLDEIRAMTADRQVEQAAIQAEIAPDLLVGDEEAFSAYRGLPGVAGKATAPLSPYDEAAPPASCGAIVATELLDSGFALLLPLATGFVAAAGMPYDPFVVAANAWQRPVAIGLGKACRELVDGEPVTLPVTLDVNKDGVAIRQG
jgi:pyruvate,water dikinase